MSSVIDERVVQMSFDNDQFEKGVSQTIKSLNKLDKTLVDTTDGEYFTNMEERISKVEQAFSKSGMVINGILLTIGQTITQYINKGLAALTQGIRGGMAEYETQMGATQTILANVKDEGKGIDDVTAALDELNTYADKTIYNFTEMTRNIGMFTAAGANLDTSVATIKGLANAAALVGANATTAARAWYQVSQAMAAGSFKLMDWRSLEISNIAGEGFKSVLTEVARKDGLAVAKMIDNGAALRDTLKSGWLTAERFAEAMKILTNELSEDQMVALGYTKEQAKMLKEIATEAEYAAIKVKSFTQLIETTNEAIGSGWAVTFRTIIGDFERARDFYTRISIVLGNVIDKISDYRNYLLDLIWNWAPSGGASPYDNFKRTLDNLLAIFSTFIGAVRAGFDNIFKWTDMNSALGKLTNFFKRATDSLVLNDSKYYTKWQENQAKIKAGLEDEVEELNDFDKANWWDLDAVNESINKLIRIFRGLFAGVDIVLRTIGDTISWVIGQIPGISNFFENLESGNLGVLGALANVADKVTMIRDMIVDLNLIPNILHLIKQSILNIIKTNPLLSAMAYSIYLAIHFIKTLLLVLKEININPFNVLLGALKLIGGAISAVIYSISEAITKIIQFVSGNTNFSFLDTIGQGIVTFIVLLNELGKGTITVADVFDYYKKKALGAFEAILHSPFVEGVVKFFTHAWIQIKQYWNTFISFFQNIGTNINDFYEKYFGDYQFDIKDLGLFGVLAAIVTLLYKFTRDVEGWASIGARIADVLNAFANKINSEALWNVAKAIGVLAASVFLLSLIPYETLMNTVSMMIGLMIMLTILFSVVKGILTAKQALQKVTKPFEEAVNTLAAGINTFIKKLGHAVLLEAVGDALIKITLAIVGLALAFEYMPNSIGKALITIGAIAAILVVLAYAFNELTKTTIPFKKWSEHAPQKMLKTVYESLMQFAKLAGLAIILEALSNAILKIAAAIAILSLLDEGGMFRGLVAIIAVVAVLTIALIGIEAVSKEAKPSSLVAFAVTIMAFSAAIAGLAVVAALVGLLPLPQLLIGLGSVLLLTTVLGLAMALISHEASIYTAGTFLSIAAMMGALGLSIAAIIGVCSLIQTETQLDAMTRAMIGFGLLFAAIMITVGIFSKFDPDVGIIYSMAVLVGVLALSILAIAASIKMLENIQIDPAILITLGVITVILAVVISVVGGLSIAIAGMGEIGFIAIAAIYGLALAISAYGYVVKCIGDSILEIADAQLKFQEALKGWWEIFAFLKNNSEEFIDTIGSAAQTILDSIPNLFGLFVSVGVAIGAAALGIILGLSSMIIGIVSAAGTMLLQIIFQISSWVNKNAELIKLALTELFTAILNLAIIALQVAIGLVIPKLYTLLFAVIFNLFTMLWNIISSVWISVGTALQGTILAPLGDLFIVGGEALKAFSDWVANLGTTIVDAIEAVTPEIGQVVNSLDLLTGSEKDLSEVTSELSENTEKQTSKMSVDWDKLKVNQGDAVDWINNKLVENGNADQQLTTVIKKDCEEKEEAYGQLAEGQGEATDAMVQNSADGASKVEQILSGNMGNITDLFSDGFSLDLLNQDEFFNAFLGNVDWFGGEVNSKDADWMLINTDLYSKYYQGLEGYAEQYYTNMEAYTEAMTGPGVDNATRKAAQDQLNAAKEALNKLNGGADGEKKWSMSKVLQDQITWVKTNTKKQQEAYFSSWTDLGSSVTDYLANYSASDPDTSMYSPNLGSTSTDTSKLESELKDRNDTIGKYDSEVQPKDLTPTIDLDSLKNEVNQANGIMTGSLLAAQNAAIGDYINTDSELNPFLKDRWQNTYNFTQNNYSPKALSRIDIYRQTQNQLRLSRGF